MKILLVEEHDSIRDSLRLLLTTNGNEVEAAANTKEAIENLAKAKPDVVIINVVTPDIASNELYKRLKDDPKTAKVPIVFLSSSPVVEDFVRGQPGKMEYLAIPFDYPQLLEAIEKVTGK